MLVISRKIGDVVMIGKDIKIVVVDIDRGKVKIGCEAPESVKIFRKELFDAKAKEAAKKAGEV